MRSVLVVDVDQGFCDLITETLQQRGYSTYTASTPSKALALLARQRIDLLLIEGQLPEMIGPDLIREIRRRGYQSPILFVSALSVLTRNQTLLAMLTRELGVYKILSKPINIDELLMYVEYLAPLGSNERTDGEISVHPTLDAIPTFQQALPHATSEAASQLEKARAAFFPELEDKLYQALEQVSRVYRDTNQLAILFQTHRDIQQLHSRAGMLQLHAISEVLGQIERGLYLLLNPKEFLASSPEVISQNPWTYLQDRLEWCLVQAQQPAEEQTVGGDESQGEYFNLLLIGKRLEDVGEMAFWANRHRIKLHAGESWETIERLLTRYAFDAFYVDVSTPASKNAQDAPLSMRQQTAAIQNGVSWVQKLRQRPEMDRIPVMFVTDQAEIHHRMMAAQITPSQLLIKPLQEHAWLDALRRMTGHQAAYSARILVVHDETGFSELVSQALEESGFSVEHLLSPLELLEALEAQEPDLLMVGFSLRGFSGLDLCRVLRINPRWGDLPVLLLAPSLAPALRISAFQTGIYAVITQQQPHEEITAQVQMHLQAARQISRTRYRDVLTHLWSRGLFLDRLERRVTESKIKQNPLHLCLLRPVGWEALAEQHGYVLRAQVLVHLAHSLTHHAPPFSIAARLDTCTLAVLIPTLPPALISATLQRIEQDFSQIQFIGKHGQSFKISLDRVYVSLDAKHKNAAELFQETQELLEHSARLG
ncbi:response regulator [Myxococcota bacterium]|nr:response regulator [Myxococcota bacterium]